MKGLKELSFRIKFWTYDLSRLNVWEEYGVGLSKAIIGEYNSEPKYIVLDPPLSESELAYLSEVARRLVFIMPRDALESRDKFYEVLKRAGIRDEKLLYYLDREIRGFSSLDPLMRDSNLENVECSLAGTPILVVHKTYGRMETNLVYSKEELDELVVRLAHMAGRSVSTFKPKIDSAILPGGHRLALTYRSEISPTSSFTIRKFPEKPWTITKMLVNKMLTPEATAWLWLLVENRLAIVVFGAMGSGKTSLINALMNLIPPDAMVGTVEDVAEFKIAHRYWVRLVARESETIGGAGRITLAQLLAHALRRNLDYVVVNEVRFDEARIWAQAIALGHGGVTSVHAESPKLVFARLKDLGVTPSLLSALHCMVWTWLFKAWRDGRQVRFRRVRAIYDIEVREDEATLKPLFTYNSEEDSLEHGIEDILDCNSARVILETNGWDEENLLAEWERRVNFLRKLADLAGRNPSVAELEMTSLIFKDFYRRNPMRKLRRTRAQASVMIPETSEHRYCPSCGRELPVKGFKFCPYCGQELAPSMDTLLNRD